MRIRRIYLAGKKKSEENKRLIYVPTTLAEVAWASGVSSSSFHKEDFELPYSRIRILEILEEIAKGYQVDYRLIVDRIIEDEAEFMQGGRVRTVMMVQSVLEKEKVRDAKSKQKDSSSYSGNFLDDIGALESMIAFAAKGSRQGRAYGYRNFVEIVYPEASLMDMWHNGHRHP